MTSRKDNNGFCERCDAFAGLWTRKQLHNYTVVLCDDCNNTWNTKRSKQPDVQALSDELGRLEIEGKTLLARTMHDGQDRTQALFDLVVAARKPTADVIAIYRAWIEAGPDDTDA